MKTRIPAIIAAAIVALLIILKLTTYVVSEREQVVVTRLSRPVHVIIGQRPQEEFEQIAGQILDTAKTLQSKQTGAANDDLGVSMGAGLYFKMPFVDRIERFPDTILEYDAEPEQIVTRDKKILEVDNFGRWRIVNPLLYRVSVRSQASARDRLDENIYSIMRAELGKNDLIEVIRTTNDYVLESDAAVEDDPDLAEAEALSMGDTNPMRERIGEGRESVMQRVTQLADQIARDRFGIIVIDVRIKRAELVESNLQAVFERMRAERSRLSKAYLSMGQRQAYIIEGETDRKVQVMLAEAEQEARTIRGEGDAQALRIYAEAFSQNAALYDFLQTLEVVKESTPDNSEFVIGVDSSLYRLMNDRN